MMTRYSLVREDGTAGDSGPLCEILDSDSYQPIDGENYPRVGCGIRVGSYYARTYSAQDWWQTSPVTEILEERTDQDGNMHVRFKTKNSVYNWRTF